MERCMKANEKRRSQQQEFNRKNKLRPYSAAAASEQPPVPWRPKRPNSMNICLHNNR